MPSLGSLLTSHGLWLRLVGGFNEYQRIIHTDSIEHELSPTFIEWFHESSENRYLAGHWIMEWYGDFVQSPGLRWHCGNHQLHLQQHREYGASSRWARARRGLDSWGPLVGVSSDLHQTAIGCAFEDIWMHLNGRNLLWKPWESMRPKTYKYH